MHIALVHVHVKSEFVEAFREAILENARNSLQEAGVIRFDVLQQADSPDHFTLVEVYRSQDDQLAHRDTNHYKHWRDTVAAMMAEPRQGIRYINVYPADENFASPK